MDAVEPQTAGNGSVWELLLSQRPGTTLAVPGRCAGELHGVHDMAIDSQGDLYAGEVDRGKRVQRFVRLP